MLGCSVWQCARKCGRLHVDTTTLVTHSVACCLAVYFAIGGLIAALLLGSLIIRSEASLPLQSSERLHELSMFSTSFSSVDARHDLKLYEMSCVVLRLPMEEFLRRRCQSLSQCDSRRHCGDIGFGAAVLVSKNVNHASIF